MSISKAIGIITSINEFGNLFQLVRSAFSYVHSQWNGSQEKKLQDEDLQQLQSDLRCLSETLPAMYNLIDRAEWRSHVSCVAQLLPKLKDAVSDAEDILDEFRWYELKVEIEGETTELSPFIEFFHRVTQGNFNKVTDIQKRLNNLSSQLEKMGLNEATPRFDKSLRPVTTSFRTEPKIFGRERELEEVVRLLGVPSRSSRRSSKRKRTSNAANNELGIAFVPVLPVVGIGGVGKTTLVQEITTLQSVKFHYDKIIWICVSDDFDEERFTKVLIKSLSGKEATAENLDDLQQDLVDEVGKRRFLLILDDIWPDALKDDGRCWRKFCAPLKSILQGSMLLVTTRFQEVANIVGTMEPVALEGLQDEIFWDFLKLCVFDSEDHHIDPQLEIIGKSILKKLKGTPLAAKTIGRLLRQSLSPAHWNDILYNELWELRQKETDILPALRLSYMYLPFHLKRCFSFCAAYPKDYNFEKANLAEIWAAEGFIEPQGSIPLQHIGDQYFEDLVNLSFFQKLRGKYVIHDLMHDMAQLVSKEECFILKNASDIDKVPQNVRHLSIPTSSVFKCSDLSNLCKHTKLRTLLFDEPLRNNIFLPEIIDRWFSELLCLRVIVCGFMWELPESISKLKHLRYLEICRACNLKNLPSSFCSLYNLQILYARKCEIERLPRSISKLKYLQKFELHIYNMEVDAAVWEEIKIISKFNQITRDLIIYNLGALSKDRATKLELRKQEYLSSLTLRWSLLRSPEHKEIEVLQALQPPTTIRSVYLKGYPGEYLPSWFRKCDGPEDMSVVVMLDRNQNEVPAVVVDNNNGRFGRIFTLLKELIIEGCQKVSSLEQFLQPSYIPIIKKIVIADCSSVESVPTDRFGDLSFLEELKVRNCPMINSHRLLVPSLKKLDLDNSGNLGENIDCSSLAIFHLSRCRLPFIELHKWSLPLLQELVISSCYCLTFIKESEQIYADVSHGRARSSTGKFQLLTHLTIECCENLETLDYQLLHPHATERFGSSSCLKDLVIDGCPRLKWQNGLMLPSSLKKLKLWSCGDLASLIPSCLENLTSLESLEMGFCEGIILVPGHLWSSNLASLKELRIVGCPDLDSIGGRKAIANIEKVSIYDCEKLTEIKQPLTRGNWWYVCYFAVWSISYEFMTKKYIC